ncbi:uncharacterized protein B0H18DRAFT_955260 [Fomitopsis serialis]|uniref:uncharacterized protein n=1 Tax=Fomitopsis serialis TaxID=139415 RepID=UPI00200893DE|nr:uncharacterized protein B0H18DRAFT_955260 [Neoantrodia serialis]KAH9924843.1 hypothetical protein B0H18DRAFT_955260 [Neoantrodia serialis]
MSQAGSAGVPLMLMESASVLLLITVAQIVVNTIEALSLGTVFLVPAMSVLVSRFLLDIYQAAENAVTISDYDHDSSSEFTRDTGLEFEMPDDWDDWTNRNRVPLSTFPTPPPSAASVEMISRPRLTRLQGGVPRAALPAGSVTFDKCSKVVKTLPVRYPLRYAVSSS